MPKYKVRVYPNLQPIDMMVTAPNEAMANQQAATRYKARTDTAAVDTRAVVVDEDAENGEED